MSIQNQVYIKKYASLFEELTPEKLTELKKMVSDDIVFSDPFNFSHGKEKFIGIFSHMFENVIRPRFEILDLSYSDKAGYIKWRLTGDIKRWNKFSLNITGMSEIISDEYGNITAHYDHWDSASQLLIFIPILGVPIRWLLKLFRVN
tara:strand:+ start:638 stop:1078 length:441 start_codon:yes stop_codon:yes gene_type:complete